MPGDIPQTLKLPNCRRVGRLRRGFYILTEHAVWGRLRPSIDQAVIGMLYSVSVAPLAAAGEPSSPCASRPATADRAHQREGDGGRSDGRCHC